jgi:hypothetical protein
VSVSRVAVAAWLSSAAVVTSAAGVGIYQLTTASSSSSSSSTSSSQPSAQTLGGGSVDSNNGNGNGNNANPGHPITLTGAVVGKLGPGTSATLNVTISNPNNQDIVVTSVTGAITSVTSAGLVGRLACSSSWYSLGSFSGSKTIAKNKNAQVPLALTLTNLPGTNQDNCKGATVRFTFTAQAQQA